MYCENSAIDLVSGLSCHFSGSSIDAPPEGAAGLAPADGDADGFFDGFFEGDVVALAPAFGVSPVRAPGRGFGVAVPLVVDLPLGLAVAFLLGVPLGDAVPEGDAEGLGCGCPDCGEPAATSRKRSWAVRLTASIRSLRCLPGISTTMFLLPWVLTSDSETPLPLTRSSMIEEASFSWVWEGVFEAVSVIRVPPSRSRPSCGLQSLPRAAAAYRSATAIPNAMSVRPARGVFFATLLVPLRPCRRRAGL